MLYNTLYPIILNQYKNKIFVETGMWEGHGIRVALDCNFEKIYSCDVDESCISFCKKKYNNSNVNMYHKKSKEFLIDFFENEKIYENITFWLDAHGRSDQNIEAPLLEELNIIKRYCEGKNNIFLIDDYHSMEKWGKNLIKNEIESALISINSNFKLKTIDRIYSMSLDPNEKNLPTKGTILTAKL